MGWVEGETVAIQYRWAVGSSERVSEVSAEFLRQDVDVIVTYGGAVTTLKQATTTIPIAAAAPLRLELLDAAEVSFASVEAAAYSAVTWGTVPNPLDRLQLCSARREKPTATKVDHQNRKSFELGR